MPHAIDDQDWPDVLRLLRDYRAGRLTARTVTPDAAFATDRRQIVGILQAETPRSYDVPVSIERLVPVAPLSTEIRVTRIDRDTRPTGTFRLALDDVPTLPIGVGFTADEFRDALAPWDLDDVAVSGGGLVTGSPVQRWRVRGTPGRITVADVQIVSGTLAEPLTDPWWTTGQRLDVYYVHRTPAYLLPGTLVTCELIPGRGYCITNWEQQPEPASILRAPERVWINCHRQAAKQGTPGLAPLCGDHTPRYLDVSSDRPLTLGTVSTPNTQLWPRVYWDAGNVWRSDYFGPEEQDLFQIEVTAYATDHGPQATLEVKPNPGQGVDDVLVRYYSQTSWDCLGSVTYRKVAHESTGSGLYAPWRWPDCVTTRPVDLSCLNPEPAGNLFDAPMCAIHWRVNVNGTELIATQATRISPTQAPLIGTADPNGWLGCSFGDDLPNSYRLAVTIWTPTSDTEGAASYIVAEIRDAEGRYTFFIENIGEPVSVDCRYSLQPLDSQIQIVDGVPRWRDAPNARPLFPVGNIGGAIPHANYRPDLFPDSLGIETWQ